MFSFLNPIKGNLKKIVGVLKNSSSCGALAILTVHCSLASTIVDNFPLRENYLASLGNLVRF